jgi:hypothetical protein
MNILDCHERRRTRTVIIAALTHGVACPKADCAGRSEGDLEWNGIAILRDAPVGAPR